MKSFLLPLVLLIATSLTAQAPLLDAITHPKFQNAVPFPTKINLNSPGTTVLEMAQKSQWLGLVNPANNARLQTTVWGYGPVGAATYPGPTLVANSGVPVNVEWRNNLPATHLLPVDQTYHKAMPAAGIPTVVHLHGGHTEPASDGHPEAWYTRNYAEKGGTWQKNIYTYDNSQEGTTLWYHDHVLGMTRLNVYAGLAGFYFLNDANDQAVNLPRGNYDKEMVFQDKQFDNLGNLFFPSDVPAGSTASAPSGQPEFFGDFILVNGMAWPFMNVEARKYRFRLLNGSDSRVYTFALSNGNSFLQIGTDDGKLNTPSVKTQLDLAPGERAEIIVDFTTLAGQNIKLLNYGPDGPFGNPGSPQADPATTGQIMEFRVNVPFKNTIANSTVTSTTNLRPTLGPIQALGTSNVTRKLALFEGTDEFGRIMPMLGIVDPTNPNNGSTLWHMPTTENIKLNDTETWEIYNTTMDAHPIHLHMVAFQVLNKQTFSGVNTPKPILMHNGATGEGAILSNIVLTGPLTSYTPNNNGLKDTYVVQPGEVVRLKAKFDRQGQYVWHCHILSHEDHDMMRNFFVGNKCATDVTPPVLSACPANINLTTTSTTAIASWTAPTATDNCSTPSVTFTTSPTTGLMNGGTFPIGTTTVRYMAMDANNNMSSCTFTVTVTVKDIIKPTITCPANIVVNTDAGKCGAKVIFSVTATDNTSATVSQISGLASGSTFAVGTTTQVFKATDPSGNFQSCSFTVIVKDDQNPTDYIIYARDEAKFGEYNYINGDVGVTASDGKASFKKNDVLNPYSVKAKNIDVDLPSSVANRIYSAANDGPNPPFYTYNGNTSGLSNFTVKSNTVLSGNYKDLSIKKGVVATIKGNNFSKITIEEGARVTFTSTVINLENLDIKGGKKDVSTTNVYFTNPTSIKVKDKVNIDSDCRINVGGPKVTFYLGDMKDDDEKFTVKADNTQLTANIMLPHGKFKVNGGESRMSILTGWYIIEELESTGKYITWNKYNCSLPSSSSSSTEKVTADISAHAEYERNVITFVTNQGLKTDYWTAEKLNDTKGNFEELALQNNTKVNEALQYLTFYDYSPSEGDNTYRIKVTYNDGSIKVSDMKTVQIKGLNSVQIFPNPANDVIGIDLSSYTDQAVDINLYNYLGQQKLFKQVDKANNKIVELDVANQPVGNYMIRIQSKGKREVTKSVIIAH